MTPTLFIFLAATIFFGGAVFRLATLCARHTSGLDLFTSSRLTVMFAELVCSVILFVLLCDGGPEGLMAFAWLGLAFSPIFTLMNLKRTNCVQAIALGVVQGICGAMGGFLITATTYANPLRGYVEPCYPISPLEQDNPMPTSQIVIVPSNTSAYSDFCPSTSAPADTTSTFDTVNSWDLARESEANRRAQADQTADAYAQRLGFRDAHDAERAGFNTGHSSYW